MRLGVGRPLARAPGKGQLVRSRGEAQSPTPKGPRQGGTVDLFFSLRVRHPRGYFIRTCLTQGTVSYMGTRHFNILIRTGEETIINFNLDA